jgi:tetratricopeptide (TPR) repeat protein
MPPEQQRRYTFVSIADYITRVARVHPQLYILEDLHWADEATLLFLEFLADRLPTIPVLVLGTYRDPPIDVSRSLEETLAGLVRRRQARLLRLKRHPRSEVETMLRGLSGQPPPQTVVTAIYGETEGNALFVEEVFRHLTETGALLDDRGCFRNDLSIDELDVPENVRLVTAHRFDRLSEPTRRMLMLASVVGRRFSFDLLAAVGELEEDALLDALDEAERARLIVPDPTLPGSLWFSHELIRQTMLTRLSAPRRQRHHLRIAVALERIHADDVELHAADIAKHLLQSGSGAETARTVRYLSMAGRQALAATAFEQALQHLEKAVALAEAIDPREQSELLFHFGMAQRSVGHWEEAIAAWRRCLDGYEALGDRGAVGHVCVEVGYSLVWATRWAEALEMFQRGLTALGEERSAVRARLLARASVPLSYGGEITMGDAMLEEALGLAVNLGDDALEAFVLSEMCAARQASMRVGDVVSAGQRAAGALRAAGELWPAATALGLVAINLVQLGRFDESARVAAEVAPLAERIGNYPALYLQGRAEGMRNFFARADLDALEAFGRWDLDFSERNLMGSWNGHSYTWLGLAEFLRGKWETALTLFEHGAAIAPPGALGGFCWGPLFHCQVYLGHRAQALALFEEKRPELPRSGRPNMWGWWAQLMAFTEGLYVLGQREEAASFHPLILEARSTGAITTSYIEGRLLERVAGIAAAAGEQWEVADEHFRIALRQADELPHRFEQLETRRFYAWMLAERGRPGDRERAADLLGEAIVGYSRLGMPRHAQLAQDARA